MKAESIEQIVDFLNKLGIETTHEQHEGTNFNRIIEFKIDDTVYFIEWWINQSYFRFKNNPASPFIPFKYINVNEFSPTTEHKYQLCFYDLKADERGQLIYNEIPFGSLKIPFNKN